MDDNGGSAWHFSNSWELSEHWPLHGKKHMNWEFWKWSKQFGWPDAVQFCFEKCQKRIWNDQLCLCAMKCLLCFSLHSLQKHNAECDTCIHNVRVICAITICSSKNKSTNSTVWLCSWRNAQTVQHSCTPTIETLCFFDSMNLCRKCAVVHPKNGRTNPGAFEEWFKKFSLKTFRRLKNERAYSWIVPSLGFRFSLIAVSIEK